MDHRAAEAKRFAADFKAHVMPDLVRQIQSLGFLVALDCLDFLDALYRVLHDAWRRGASYLSDAAQASLEATLAKQLMAVVTRYEPWVRAEALRHARIERQVQAHWHRFNAWLANTSDTDLAEFLGWPETAVAEARAYSSFEGIAAE